ncbi:pantoate--beta-alanine ligase [Blastococcus sp. Marseille-P5729]|uniref:pantoate--beta-alanine ligase n=1 Tax=Blastococcus sp. Marseille-P5729 TaxID=2086582 RepID=UPI000D0F5AC4|nr:pantoate--beta-alanine ligase [Blastococcus sp. Marseille-P5729]
MRVVTTREELRAARAELDVVGLVPTMGYLHDGHLSLVRRAKKECGAAIATIFVNPLQFGPKEDLGSYPRDRERDLALLEETGCDVVWTPSDTDVYPPGFDTYVDVEGITDGLEGAHRPGHFRGVSTVLSVIFNVVQPTRAYFGQKDAQQVVVVKKMVGDLGMPLEVIASPTIREPDGLAMSSRNSYLDPTERERAVVLRRALDAVEKAWQDGETHGALLRSAMMQVLDAEPLAEPDYVSIAHPDTLEELDHVDPAVGALASLAVRLGKPRLLDNVVLPPR